MKITDYPIQTPAVGDIVLGVNASGTCLFYYFENVTLTAAWNPGIINDDDCEIYTFVDPRITNDGTWVAIPSFTSLSGKWLISANLIAGGCEVVIFNKTGAPVNLPNGTVRVTCLKTM